MTDSKPLSAGLYVVATPIGNLRDITLRAIDVLKSCDLIACEDTRQTGKLLAHYGIKAKLFALHDHNEAKAVQHMLAQLTEHKTIALVSDAGTPLISDPGYKLVQAVREASFDVFTIPGPSALTAAISIAGLPTDRFLFLGFLPAKMMARRKALEEVKDITTTLICYESPHRLVEALQAIQEIFGEREVAVARELTKIYEEVQRGTAAVLTAHYEAHPPKGEVVILIAPPPAGEVSAEQIDTILQRALTKGLSTKDAATEVARITGIARKTAYARAMELAKS